MAKKVKKRLTTKQGIFALQGMVTTIERLKTEAMTCKKLKDQATEVQNEIDTLMTLMRG